MSIRVTGMDRAERMLSGVADRAKDMRPALDALASDLRAMVDNAFATNTSPDGTPWAPRVSAYRYADGRPARPRSEARGGRDLLERTGDLRGSVTISVTPTGITQTASSGHAAFQQYGTRHAPARPFLPVDRGGPMRGGAAGAFWGRVADTLGRFIAEGRR